MRDMTSGFTAQVTAARLAPVLLVEAEFAEETVRVWSGLGDLVHAGHTWVGAGNLLEIGGVEERMALEALGASFTLSGVPASYTAVALQAQYQNRAIRLYFGVRMPDGSVDSLLLFSGVMDVMEISDDGQVSRITVSAESDMIRLKTSPNRYYTPEDQKTDYPDDLGLDFVPTITDVQIKWGAG